VRRHGDYAGYLRDMRSIYAQMREVLKPGARAVINAANLITPDGVSPLAWDAALYADIARLGFGCGMVTEAEAWTALKNIVPAVVGTYASWQEYADHYLLGRTVWRDGLRGTQDAAFPASQSTADAHLRALLDPANRASPWNLAPWDTISHPDRPR